MRSLSADILASQSRQVTKPIYLIKLELGGSLQRWSTRGDITTLGEFWQGGIASFRAAENWRTATVTVNNADAAWTAAIMGGEWRLASVDIYLYGLRDVPPYCEDIYCEDYYTSPTLSAESGDAVLLWTGEAVAAPSVYPVAQIQLAAVGLRTAYTPRHVVRKPVFNHLPQPGQIVEWEGERYELRPRNG